MWLLFVFTILSCSKIPASLAYTEKTVNIEAINQVLNTNNSGNQKTMYRSLNAYEKTEIWSKKFKDYLSNNNLDKNQITFIQEIIQLLKPELFEIESELVAGLKENVLKAKAIQLFGANEAAFLFTTIYSNKNTDTNLAPDESGTGCKCSINHDWCSNIYNLQSMDMY